MQSTLKSIPDSEDDVKLATDSFNSSVDCLLALFQILSLSRGGDSYKEISELAGKLRHYQLLSAFNMPKQHETEVYFTKRFCQKLIISTDKDRTFPSSDEREFKFICISVYFT